MRTNERTFMNMKYLKSLIIMLCVLIGGNLLALNIGDKAPSLNVSEWVKGSPVTLYPKNEQGKKIYVVFFWATWSNASPNLMNFISTEKNIYGKDEVAFVGISKESPRRIKKFLKKYPDINISIAIDDKAETYSEYMHNTKGVPMFFIIDQNKKLIWKGGAFEADRVLSRALNGTFNFEDQKKIEKYRKDIQKAAQMLNRKEEVFYARKILKIDPTDRIAMNIIVNHYIMTGKEVKAIDFIRSSRKVAGGNKYIQRALYFLELSIVRGMNNAKGKEYMAELVTNYKDTFKNNPEALNSLIIIISRDLPLEIMPLSNMLEVSKNAVELAKHYQNAELQSSCLQSLARVYYFIGRLNKAVSLQEEASLLIDKTKKNRKEVASLVEAYYKEALKLNQEK